MEDNVYCRRVVIVSTIASVISVIFFVFISLIFSSCSPINQKLGLEDDNLGEECVEVLIQSQTGMDIDLSPGTPEGKHEYSF